MLKAYKYRIYPNSEQRIQIAKTFGCCRFVYNQTLAYRKDIYEKEKKSVSKTDCNNYCNRELKKNYEWLKEADKFALTNAIYNMDAAYQKFFKEHAGFPKFKSKHDKHKSYTTNYTNGNITVNHENGKIKLPKLKEVKAKLHRNFSGQIKSATVSQMPSGKYYVSILVETEHKEMVHTTGRIGIDLGIKDLCITSDGKIYENLKIIRKYEKQLVKLQRQLSHKEKRSKNYHKTKKKIAVFEIDERSSKLIYPYIKPTFAVCTNLFRDSIHRNANPEFIFNIINSSLPEESHLILNADDLISCNLGEKNKKTYFSINRLPSDREESINLINDMRICPKCHHKLKYNYVRYHHIGNAKCEFCGYASPVGDYKAELDLIKMLWLLHMEIIQKITIW